MLNRRALYLNKLKKANDNIEILGEYINARTKIKVKCNQCSNIWHPIPDSIVRGHGCNVCATNKVKKTNKQFLDDLKKRELNLVLLGDYITNNTKILFMCRKCDTKFMATPSSVLSNGGCRVCSDRSRRLTINELKDRANKNIIIIGKYTNSKTKIECKCKICKNIWFAYPSNISNGSGCGVCAGKNKTTEQFKEEVSCANKDVNVIGEYSHSLKHISVSCKVCNHKWVATPSNLVRGSGCPKCRGLGFDKNKSAILYYLSINNGEAYKIGITNRTIKDRFKGSDLKKIKVLKIWEYKLGADAFRKEQGILKKYKNHKWDGISLLMVGNTELFSVDVLGLDNE